MTQQNHLTAWQVHAPWPKRSQIEQDLRLSRGVAATPGGLLVTGSALTRGAHHASIQDLNPSIHLDTIIYTCEL
jgi:hypothetical protein